MKYKCNECGHEVVNIDGMLEGIDKYLIMCETCDDHITLHPPGCVIVPRKQSG
jgi:DNA-directed RNA polymerase subunit RPC12/RpoP